MLGTVFTAEVTSLPEVVASLTLQPLCVRSFASLTEALRAFPVDRTIPLPKDQYQAIAAKYAFAPAEWINCQLVRTDGAGKCNKSHGNGWIIVLKDGTYGFIGRDCAKGHFNADDAFTKEAARADNQIKTEEALKRLQELLGDKKLRERLRAAFTTLTGLERDVKRVRDALPHAVKTQAHNMRKSGRTEVVVLFARLERVENKDGKVEEITKWDQTPIGAINKPIAIETAVVAALRERLRLATETLRAAGVLDAVPINQLRTWTRRLDDIDPASRAIQEAVDALRTFTSIENLKLLCWVCRESRDQLAVAQFALSVQRGTTVSAEAARRPLEDWRREVSAKHGERAFRIP